MPIPCAPETPHVNRDLSEIVGNPREMHFGPDDANKPRGGAAQDTFYSAEAYDEEQAMARVIEGDLRRTEHLGFNELLGWIYRVPHQWFKEIQAKHGIPFYTWFQHLRVSTAQVDAATHQLNADLRAIGHKITKGEAIQAQMLIESKYSEVGYVDLLKKVPTRVQEVADKIENAYRGFLQREGFSELEIQGHFATLPQLRAVGGDWPAFIREHHTLPRPTTLASFELKNGSLLLDEREWDALRIFSRLGRAVANGRYLEGPWDDVLGQLRLQLQLAEKAGSPVPANAFKVFSMHLYSLKHKPDMLQMSVTRVWNKVINQLMPKGVANKLSARDSYDAVSAILSANYFANMAFSPGFALRNFFQAFLPMMIVGFEDGAHGLKVGARWLRGEKGLHEHYINRGIIGRDIESRVSEAAAAGIEQLSSGGGGLQRFFSWMRNNGTAWFRASEGFNRVSAYEMGRQRALRIGKLYMDKKINWEEFLERSKVDMLDVKNGPFIEGNVRYVLHEGKGTPSERLQQMAHNVGKELMETTQFIYARAAQPYPLQSTVGRFLGQYGTWPAWFREFLSNDLNPFWGRGSRANRLKAFGRFAAINGAIYKGAEEVFGVDVSRWVFFSPLGYSGGPYMQLGQGAITTMGNVLTPGEPDLKSKLEQTRFLHQLYQQTTPAPWALIRNTLAAYRELEQEDWKSAMKRLSGFPPVQER